MLDCRQIRKDIIQMSFSAGKEGAHLGGALSLVEILAVIYGDILGKVFAKETPSEDTLILSKGHGVLAQYACLRQLGLISQDELNTYKSDFGKLPAHPSINNKFHFKFATGSLGQGLSFGVGNALANKLLKNSSKTFVILGDGECDEGQVWEAANSACNLELDNLIAIIDRNRLQYDGETIHSKDSDSLKRKWEAFGWSSYVIDGHNTKEIYANIVELKQTSRPKVFIANTIKGKGISFMEGFANWHSNILTRELYLKAMEELNE